MPYLYVTWKRRPFNRSDDDVVDKVVGKDALAGGYDLTTGIRDLSYRFRSHKDTRAAMNRVVRARWKRKIRLPRLTVSVD